MAETTQLTIQDVANAVAIIDICVKRGAIEGGELTAVGAVRDKLAQFVKANTPKTEEVADTKETASE
jgi:hypothetical protein